MIILAILSTNPQFSRLANVLRSNTDFRLIAREIEPIINSFAYDEVRMYSISVTVLLAATLAIAHPNPNVVATVSCPQDFVLDNYTFPVRGISSWPLVVGDKITTQQAAAVITLQSGTRIRIEPSSSVRISEVSKQVKLELISGRLSRFENDQDDRDKWHRKPPHKSRHRCRDEHDNDGDHRDGHDYDGHDYGGHGYYTHGHDDGHCDER